MNGNEPPSVELIIHHMRQSKMDSVRKELEKRTKMAEKGHKESFYFLMSFYSFFSETSNNAPLP